MFNTALVFSRVQNRAFGTVPQLKTVILNKGGKTSDTSIEAGVLMGLSSLSVHET